MSKKIAAGSKNIVLDVKVGSGAFMKTPEDAERLAREMVKIGKGCGRSIAAMITDMDTPLGNAVGNALEVREAVSVLRGETRGDLFEICVSLAAEMLSLALEVTPEEGKKLAADAIASGAAFEKMKEWVALQGGDACCLEDTSKLPTCAVSYDVKSPFEGYITAMDAEAIGIASMMLGAGRETKDDAIDYGAGILIGPKVGDYVRAGDVLCTLYASDGSLFDASAERYLTALSAGDEKPVKKPLIYKTVR